MLHVDSKRIKQMFLQYVEAGEKWNLELEDIIRKKVRTDRDTAQRLRELDSTVANLETNNELLKSENESMKNFLQAKDDTMRQLQEKWEENMAKAQMTISELNDEVIAIMDDYMALKRKNSTLMSGFERCQDAFQDTMASISEPNLGSACSTASSSSLVPSKKKMKSSDMTTESTLFSSPSQQLSPATLSSLLYTDRTRMSDVHSVKQVLLENKPFESND